MVANLGMICGSDYVGNHLMWVNAEPIIQKYKQDMSLTRETIRMDRF